MPAKKIDDATLPTLPDGQSYFALPTLANGRCYIDIATDLVVRLGCGVGERTFHPADHTAAIRDGTYAYGLRQCGGDGGAKGADATDAVKRAGVIARCDAIDDGTHRYGVGGGGSALSTYVVVLREKVVAALVKIGHKKVDAEKATRKDEALAYVPVAKAVADSTRASAKEADKAKVTTERVLAIMWPKVTTEAKAEAARRDKASGAITDALDLSAILALPEAGEKDAA